jgi:putative phosphoribosyl transferase
LFSNRQHAGAMLAQRLLKYRGQHALVLALPRGGVPVAAEIARQLHADLDVMVARKLGAPDQEELAIGAVAADGTRFVNEELVHALRVSPTYLAEVTRREQQEAKRRERLFRAGLPQLDVAGRVVILVDDGLATGATMRAAVWSLRRAEPAKLIVAVPVGAADSCDALDSEVDELVCLHRPTPFYSVGMYFRDFEQTTDDEVVTLLRAHRTPLAHAPLLGHAVGRR